MIEQALYEHLKSQEALALMLATYNNKPAIFNQEVPADSDPLWGEGPQYSRLVFSVDIQGDPERTMGGTLTLDIMCKADDAFPEVLEPVVRGLIDGYFFSSTDNGFIAAAQWKNSSYFTDPVEHVTGCTMAFELLGFPIISTNNPDVVARFSEWSAKLPGVTVINWEPLPTTAWKPDETTAIYWRVSQEKPCNWIPDTYQTVWRTATVKGHIFAKNKATAATIAQTVAFELYSLQRLLKTGEAPLMVDRGISIENGADPLRGGQLAIEATYGVIVKFGAKETIKNINVDEGRNQ